MLDGFAKFPAFIRTAHWDAIAWNKIANRLFGFSQRTPERRNFLRLCFLDADFRTRLPNWSADAQALVAKFRSNYGKYRDDPAMEALVKEMTQSSPEFRKLWQRHDVMNSGEGIKIIRVEGKGIQRFEHTSFSVNGEPDLNLVVYMPLGPQK